MPHTNLEAMSEVKSRSIPAGEFKARCLALLDEVQRTGEEIVVTKYGKPVARLAPLKNSIQHVRKSMNIEIHDDIISPLDPEDWGSLS